MSNPYGSSSCAFNAVRGPVVAALELKASVRLTTAIVSAAARAATSVKHLSADPLVEALVADRLELVKPALTAQVAQGITRGENCGSARGLVSQDCLVRRNVALHAGFDKSSLVSSLSGKELRKAQPG